MLKEYTFTPPSQVSMGHLYFLLDFAFVRILVVFGVLILVSGAVM